MHPYFDNEHAGDLLEQVLLTDDSHCATLTHTGYVCDISLQICLRYFIFRKFCIHDLCFLFNFQSVPFPQSQHLILHPSVAHVMMSSHPPADIKGHLVTSSNIVGVLMQPQMMLR